MMNICIAEMERNLPEKLDTTALVAVCWGLMKSGLMKSEGQQSSGQHSVLFHFAYSRKNNIVENLTLSEKSVSEVENLVSQLEDLFLPYIFLLFERIQFLLRVQGLDEREEDYLKALYVLSEACEFGALSDISIRTQFSNHATLQSSSKDGTETAVCSENGIITCNTQERGTQLNRINANHENIQCVKVEDLPSIRDTCTNDKTRKFSSCKMVKQTSVVGKKLRKFCEKRRVVSKERECELIGNQIISMKKQRNKRNNNVLLPDISRTVSTKCKNYEIKLTGRKQVTFRKIFECFLCKKKFPTYYKYKTHLNSHICSCVICGDTNIHPSDLSVHMSGHLGTEHESEGWPGKKVESECSCSKCQLIFFDKKSYTDHLESHKIQCELCGKTLISLSAYTVHMNGHKGVKPLKCPYCPRSFTRQGDLNFHKKRHNPDRSKDNVCHICACAFYRVYELQRHLKLHTGESPHICRYCGKCFVDRTTCERHIRTHTGYKPFTCEKCGKSFAQQANLDAHRDRYHTARMQHECPMCKIKFEKKFYLKPHIESHYVDNPFKCDICGACFKHKSGLKRHKYIHTGLKTFICNVCGKAFPWQRNLIRHMKVHDPSRLKFLRPWEKVALDANCIPKNTNAINIADGISNQQCFHKLDKDIRKDI